MADQFTRYHLSSLPIFAHLPPEQIDLVAQAAELQRYELGSIVFAEGDATRGMYKFVSGQAELWQSTHAGQPRMLATVNSNQYVNEQALAQQSRESATLRVMQQSIVLMISRDKLIDVLVNHPEILPNIALKIEMPMVSPRYNPQPQPIHQQKPSFKTPLNVPHAHKTPNQIPNAPISMQAQSTPQHNESTEFIPDSPKKKRKTFHSQRDDEEVWIDLNRHWWAYMHKVWLPLLVFFIMVWLSTLVDNVGVAVAIDGLAVILPGGLMLYFYLEWRNDHLIVTNQRVLHIERNILTLNARISEIPLHSIQEINADDIIENDPFSRLFSYGKIELKTPGGAGNVIFKVIRAPQRIQNVIIEHRKGQQQQQERQHIETIQADVNRALGITGTMPEAEAQADEKSKEKSKRIRTWLGWTKQIGENGEAIYRKHPLFWLKLTWLPLLISFASGAFLLGSLFMWDLLGIIDTLLALFVFIVGAGWAYLADWDWRHDRYVIGDETIQLIHQRPFWLQNENDQVYLERIDNVISDKGGIIQNIFNYGNVRLLLVGSDKNDAKVFKYVSNPQEVQAEITKHQDNMRRHKQAQSEQQRRQEFTDYLAVYHQSTGANQNQSNKGIPAIPDLDQPPMSDTGQNPQPNPPGRNRLRPPNIPR